MTTTDVTVFQQGTALRTIRPLVGPRDLAIPTETTARITKIHKNSNIVVLLDTEPNAITAAVAPGACFSIFEMMS